MKLNTLRQRFYENRFKPALCDHTHYITYNDILRIWYKWGEKVKGYSGKFAAYENSVFAIPGILAAIEAGMIVYPQSHYDDIERLCQEEHTLITKLKARNHPGLVLFTSGSSGEPKAALHDLVPILDKFETLRHSKSMMLFMDLDHIGGLNTALYCLYNTGYLVQPKDRTPDVVCEAIEAHLVQVLPTTPTFLNLLLLSGASKKYDLSSLELITYGTEPMPPITLKKAQEEFPDVKFQQTYGSTEVGILRSKSRQDGSTWVKVGGEGYKLRVVDGLLEVKAKSSMLGYLNAPSPFTDDGWYKTGDMVDQDGDWIRIIGRKKEFINVGGDKVHPVEVENLILQMPGVEDVVISAVPNPIMGQVVKATVKLLTDETRIEFRKRLHEFLGGKVDPYKIPMRLELSKKSLHGDRIKKVRCSGLSQS